MQTSWSSKESLIDGSQHRNEILEDEINKLRLKEAEYNSQNKDNEISEIYK